jgi:hypothetical protein
MASNTIPPDDQASAPSPREKQELALNVARSHLAPDDDANLLSRFNELNLAIVDGLPAMARAYDTLHTHLPMLREMQALLSQRPKGSDGGSDFTMLRSVAGRTVRMAIPIKTRQQLPTWSGWLAAYSMAIDYSVRHIQRLMFSERPGKTIKECPWSIGQHNRLLDAAAAGSDVVKAIRAGVDTTELCDRIEMIMDSIPANVIESEYQQERRVVRKKPARRGDGSDREE